MTNKNKRVAIIQVGVLHYRVAFCEGLKRRLDAEGIDFDLYYGEVGQSTFLRQLSFGTTFKRKLLPGGFIWQPVLGAVLKADLVVVEHSNKVAINYLLFLARYLGGPKLAFWGHGRNHQTDRPDSLQERVKTWMGRRGDWYFAYTWKVREELIAQGYDESRITDVQNAVVAPEAQVDPAEVDALRDELGLAPDSIVGLYCGRIYPKKRLDLLVEAARQVREAVPSFRLVIAGGGIDEGLAEDAAEAHDYVHFVGPVFGERKAAIFALSRFIAFPGLLGLGVVDAFHYGVPPIAAEFKFHSPEIAYLIDGQNGLMTEESAQGLARGMIRVCTDDELWRKLVSGCRESSKKITIEEMYTRFADGIISALN